MKKTTSVLLMLLAIVVVAACSKGGAFKRTKSGLMYKIISSGTGATAKRGEILKVNFTQTLTSGSKDSLLTSSYEGLPTYAQVDSVGPVYNPAEIFDKLRKGDSAVIVMLADSLQKNQGQLPPFVKKGDKFTLAIKVLDIFKSEEDVRKDQTAQMETKKKDEIQQIQQYLTKNNIQAEKSSKGVFVQIQEKGDGPKVDSGKAVHVMYKGTTFEGTVFDSNLDTSFGHPDPYVFVVGQRGAIEGWDDGLRLLNKGGKARMYIPSMLAYGPNAPQGAPFKAYENLIFDVEVIDVTDPPKGRTPFNLNRRPRPGANNPGAENPDAENPAPEDPGTE
jgi:FKBP-type peptidyl-prolyl cis-trans isomerase FkpA